MIDKLKKRIVSWWFRKKIGDIKYVKASPFLVGSYIHLLPSSIYRKEERNSLKFCYNKYMWNGIRWIFVERCEKTQEEWILENVK